MTRRSLLWSFAAIAGPAFADDVKEKSLGTAQAPITIEIFSDYQCPACKALYENTLQQVIDNYVKPGKVYLVHRDFPLPMHAHGREASLHACAAGRLGKYEPVARALFRDQQTWEKTGNLDPTLASVLNADEVKKVKALVKDPAIGSEVDKDVELGKQANVTQTPTMVLTHMIRRYPIAGVVQYSVLKQFLDSLLVK